MINEQQRECDLQSIGRYMVHMYHQSVVLIKTTSGRLLTLLPGEALVLLQWLKQRECDLQSIGRYMVHMYHQSVVLIKTTSGRLLTLLPGEALMLLQWLKQHQEDFFSAAIQLEDELVQCF